MPDPKLQCINVCSFHGHVYRSLHHHLLSLRSWSSHARGPASCLWTYVLFHCARG